MSLGEIVGLRVGEWRVSVDDNSWVLMLGVGVSAWVSLCEIVHSLYSIFKEPVDVYGTSEIRPPYSQKYPSFG